MTWIKLDDGIFDSAAFLRIGKDAKLLHLAGMCHSGRATTDGAIHRNSVPVLAAQAGISNPKKALSELIAAGLWERSDDGFQIVNYLETNRSAAEIEKGREEARKRMENLRSQKVRPNKSRTNGEVRSTDTDTERTEAEDGRPVAGGDAAEGGNWGLPVANPVPAAPKSAASRRAPAARPSTKPGQKENSFLSEKNGKTPSPTVPPVRATFPVGAATNNGEADW